MDDDVQRSGYVNVSEIRHTMSDCMNRGVYYG